MGYTARSLKERDGDVSNPSGGIFDAPLKKLNTSSKGTSPPP